MNTATRIIQPASLASSTPSLSSASSRLLNIAILFFLVLSAFGIIYLKDLNRRLFIQYQSLQIAHDQLYEDWGKLLLEQSTWATQARIKKIAQNRLSMNNLAPEEVGVLSLHP